MMLFLRSLAFNLTMLGSCVVLGVWARLIRPFRRPDAVLRVGQLWGRVTLRALGFFCGIRVEILGRDVLPDSGPALIAAQHQSAFDTMIWLQLLPRPAYVLKQELVRMPLLGPLLPAAGFIAIDRAGGSAALRKMLAECRRAIAQGRQIVIFPEGTRVPAGETGIIQPGILALARSLDLPVIPASTNSGFLWGKKAFKKYPGLLTVRLHPPISMDGDRRGMLSELARLYYGPGVAPEPGRL